MDEKAYKESEKTRQIKSDIAEHKARDAEGHFIKSGTPPGDAIKTDSSVSTPFSHPPTPSDPSHPSTDPIDQPLVQVSLFNPFSWLLHWLDAIRKHQTTTFDFKIKLPLYTLLIIIPVIIITLAGVFHWGQQTEKAATAAIPTPTPIVIIQPTATPAPFQVSKLGTIKATYQNSIIAQIAPTNPITQTDATPSAIPTPTPVPALRYVLVDQNGSLTFLVVPSDLTLTNYLNQRVLITGLFDTTKNTLGIKKYADIEVVP